MKTEDYKEIWTEMWHTY